MTVLIFVSIALLFLLGIDIFAIFSLKIVKKYSELAWSEYKRRSLDMKKYVRTLLEKNWKKKLLFDFGLTYVESGDARVIYFFFSLMAVICSLSLLLEVKSKLLLVPLCISLFLFVFNIIYCFKVKYDMKKFY